MKKTVTTGKIEIRELAHTWGCSWNEIGKQDHGSWFDSDKLPMHCEDFLFLNGGNAVNKLLENNIGEIIRETPGIWGNADATNKTIVVDVEKLEAFCQSYLDEHRESIEQQLTMNSVNSFYGDFD